MKVLLTGATGMLGQELLECLSAESHELTAIRYRQSIDSGSVTWIDLDITHQAATYNTVSRINPDAVIHCASYNSVDSAETDPDTAFRINSLGSRNVALACQRFDTPMVHVSTDYVFDGAKREPYNEWDVPHPLSQYAKSKYWAEVFVSDLLRRFYIVRVSWLFGRHRKNFVDVVLENAKEGKSTLCAEDMVSVPTYCKDAAQAICQLIQEPLYGVYHLTNGQPCSRYEWASHIVASAGYSKKDLKKVSLKDLNLKALRPPFSALGCRHWELNGFEPLRDWKQAVNEYLEGRRVS